MRDHESTVMPSCTTTWCQDSTVVTLLTSLYSPACQVAHDVFPVMACERGIPRSLLIYAQRSVQPGTSSWDHSLFTLWSPRADCSRSPRIYRLRHRLRVSSLGRRCDPAYNVKLGALLCDFTLPGNMMRLLMYCPRTLMHHLLCRGDYRGPLRDKLMLARLRERLTAASSDPRANDDLLCPEQST